MRTYAPLVLMITLVVVFTGLIVFFTDQSDAAFVMQMFMGSFFLIFGGLKVLRVRDFAKAYREYDILAMRSKAYAHVYPFIEVGLALGYFTNWQPVLVNSITIVVMLIGAIGVFLKLMKREKVMCACLGTVFKVPMTWVTLGEDLLMAGMAAWMLAVLL